MINLNYYCKLYFQTAVFMMSYKVIILYIYFHIDTVSIYRDIMKYNIITGFGFGLVYLPSIVSVSYYFEKRRALATGIAVCGAGVGGFLFAPIGRYLLIKFDWQNAMLIVAAVVLNTCICGGEEILFVDHLFIYLTTK